MQWVVDMSFMLEIRFEGIFLYGSGE